MQRLLPFLLLLCLAACERETAVPASDAPGPPLTRAELNAHVDARLRATDRVFDWNAASDAVVWSALTLSDHQAALGYRPAGVTDVRARIHELDLTAPAWRATRDALVGDLLEATERATGTPITEEELFVAPEDGVLPVLEVRILHPDVLAAFRGRPDVRYLEPSNYGGGDVELRSDSGCGGAEPSVLAAADYATVSPGAKVGWTYAQMGIPAAWARTTGEDVGLCIIDSGTYPEQDLLNGSFGSGRRLVRAGTYQPSFWSSRTDGPDDQCGHGTQMAGIAAAPRSATGASVGVAYRSDLLSIRATSDVVINASKEKRGVKDALVLAGNDAVTRVISMSIGDVFSSGTVEDGIHYARNRGKLIFCAAGTSLDWTSWYGVIFPANLPETVAVTGVRDGTSFERCTTCHDGREVDFVAVMQRRDDDGRTALTLARSGSAPGYVGGSSAATATVAGVAALVWATDRGQQANEVLERMKRTASNYPTRDGNFGWGLVDADRATR